MKFNPNAGGLRPPLGHSEKRSMARLLAPLAFAATLAATGALAQSSAPVHTATINDVKVSGVVATNTNTGTAAGSLDSVTNLLGNFSDARPVMPVLNPPVTANPGPVKN
jgi:hypothetical protein